MLILFLALGCLNLPSVNAEDMGPVEELYRFVEQESLPLTLESIEALGLKRGRAAQRPWSDTYWPDQSGSIAAPYAHSSFPGLPWGYQRSRSYIIGEIEYASAHFDRLTSQEVALLSPSQKYDLLLGDRHFTLSRKIIEMIDQQDRNGLVAFWSGICHGWSPASIQSPRPLHSFDLKGQAGHTIRFYPSDVKALLSFLWAKSYAQNFVQVKGWQCRDKRVHRDFYGRFTEDRCFDVNPGFVFLAMVSEIGMQKRAVVMDRNYDGSVQNQPTFRYEYRYVRLSNGMATDELDRAVLPRRRVWDPYARYRSSRAVYLVGVEMKLWYTKETDPTQRETDSDENDRVRDVTLHLSLELDAQKRIVGGEWHEQGWNVRRPSLMGAMEYSHPDILWMVPKELKAWSIADGSLGDEVWDGNAPLSEKWLKAAQTAILLEDPAGSNSRYGNEKIIRPQPLTKIIDVLLEKSRSPSR
jgi:hypothetical protein